MSKSHGFVASEVKGRLIFAVRNLDGSLGYSAIRCDGSAVCQPQPNRATTVSLAIADYRQEVAATAAEQAQQANQQAQKMMGTMPNTDPGCCDDDEEATEVAEEAAT